MISTFCRLREIKKTEKKCFHSLLSLRIPSAGYKNKLNKKLGHKFYVLVFEQNNISRTLFVNLDVEIQLV